MEKDNEINVNGGSFPMAIGIGARIYDSRLGRWVTLYPLMHEYPMYSGYSSFNKNPLFYRNSGGKVVRPSTVKIENNSKTTIVISGDGAQYNLDVGIIYDSWEDEKVTKQAVTLNPGDKFEAKTTITKNIDGTTTKTLHGEVTRADGTVMSVWLHDVDFIDVQDGQKISYTEENFFSPDVKKEVTNNPEKEFNNKENVQRKTTIGVDDGNTANDKPDDWVQTPAKGEIKLSGSSGTFKIEGTTANNAELKSNYLEFSQK